METYNNYELNSISGYETYNDITSLSHSTSGSNILKRKNGDQDLELLESNNEINDQIPSPLDNSNNNHQNKKIKLHNNNNSSSNQMNRLFLKVFGSIVIKRIINDHLRLFKQHYKQTFNSKLQLSSYHHRLYLTTLKYNCNSELEVGDIPYSVNKLYLGCSSNFNQELVSNLIPSSVRKLVFGDQFNQYINCGDIPSGVESISMGVKFNQFIGPFELPLSLKYLKLSENFNQIIVYDSLPPFLEVLVFGETYNREIEPGVLGDSIKSIKFGKWYSHPLNCNNIPSNIETISIYESYYNKFNPYISKDYSSLSKLSKLKYIQVYSDKNGSSVSTIYYYNNGLDSYNNLLNQFQDVYQWDMDIIQDEYIAPSYENTLLEMLDDLKIRPLLNRTTNINEIQFEYEQSKHQYFYYNEDQDDYIDRDQQVITFLEEETRFNEFFESVNIYEDLDGWCIPNDVIDDQISIETEYLINSLSKFQHMEYLGYDHFEETEDNEEEIAQH